MTRHKIIDEYTYLPLTDGQKRHWRKKAREAGHFVKPRSRSEALVEYNKSKKIADEFTHLPLSKGQKHYRRNTVLTLEKQRQYRQSEEGKAVRKAWREANKERLAQYQRDERARRKQQREQAARRAELEKANKYWSRRVKELNVRGSVNEDTL